MSRVGAYPTSRASSRRRNTTSSRARPGERPRLVEIARLPKMNGDNQRPGGITSEAGGNNPVGTRRRSHAGNPRQAGHLPGKRNAGRRLSAPAVLPVGQPTGKKRKKACGRQACGWVTHYPGTECSTCPGSVVHSADETLCSVCHRLPDDEGFTHLRADRLGRAVTFVAALRQGDKTLPLAIVRDFSPSKDCLCQRPDCFLAYFAEKERKAEFRQCSKCKYRKSDKSRVRWYPMDAAGDHVAEGNAMVSDGDWWCGRCYQSRLNDMKRDDKPPEQAANKPCGSGDEAPTLLEPLSTVRRMVDHVLGRGEILCWQDVAGWLAAERAKVGMEEITGKYARSIVLDLFTGMDADPDSKSRLVRADGAQAAIELQELDSHGQRQGTSVRPNVPGVGL